MCDGELDEMTGQFEDSEVVTVLKRSFVIERHRRQKYRCRCNANVVTAPAAPKLQAGGRYSVEFGVDVALSKYLDHLPLERQVRMMRREGLETDSQTLWDQLNVLARHLAPVYDALGEQVLKSPVIHADETRWPLMGSKKKSGGTVWGVSSPDIAYYRMLPTKSTDDGRTLLGNYRGIAVVDGYAVYEKLAREGPGDGTARAGPQFRLAHCWAHVKRKFDEASEQHPQECSEVLGLIKALYDVEREVPGLFPGDDEAQKLRLRLRKQDSVPLLESLDEWAKAQRGLPRSDFGKAVRYLTERWETLKLFLDNPLVPLDNNHAERALRGPVVGRKNHYGSRSKRGTEVAALFYTLCETAKLQGVEPRTYLLKATYAAIDKPGVALLPEARRPRRIATPLRSLSQLSSRGTASTYIPRLVIRFRTRYFTPASVRWLSNPRADNPVPRSRLNRDIAFSARLCRVQPLRGYCQVEVVLHNIEGSGRV